MTTTTVTRSAYPTSVEALLPYARQWAAELGRPPSRNQLMKRFRVGGPKARALLDALSTEPTAPAPAAPDGHGEADDTPVRTVLLVPDETAQSCGVTDTTGPEFAGFRDRVTSLLRPPVDPGTTEVTDTTETPAGRPADDTVPDAAARRPVVWPVLVLCLPAFVAIWAGWVEMGRLTGFGKVALLPGIADSVVLDTAITLPIGVETYAAYALWAWLSRRIDGDARRFAKWSAIGSLAVGALGQVAFHLMSAAGWTSAPWPITAVVACIPVAVLGMGAALAHLMHHQH